MHSKSPFVEELTYTLQYVLGLFSQNCYGSNSNVGGLSTNKKFQNMCLDERNITVEVLVFIIIAGERKICFRLFRCFLCISRGKITSSENFTSDLFPFICLLALFTTQTQTVLSRVSATCMEFKFIFENIKVLAFREAYLQFCFSVKSIETNILTTC